MRPFRPYTTRLMLTFPPPFSSPICCSQRRRRRRDHQQCICTKLPPVGPHTPTHSQSVHFLPSPQWSTEHIQTFCQRIKRFSFSHRTFHSPPLTRSAHLFPPPHSTPRRYRYCCRVPTNFDSQHLVVTGFCYCCYYCRHFLLDLSSSLYSCGSM